MITDPLFYAAAIPAVMIMGLAKSYTLVSLTQGPDTARLGAIGFSALTSVFVIGLEVAAPAIIALIVADAAFAIVARAVPQMNVFVVGLPAKIMLGFATVAVSLPFVGMHVQDDLAAAEVHLPVAGDDRTTGGHDESSPPGSDRMFGCDGGHQQTKPPSTSNCTAVTAGRLAVSALTMVYTVSNSLTVPPGCAERASRLKST